MSQFRKPGAYTPENTAVALDTHIDAIGGDIHSVDDVNLKAITAKLDRDGLVASALIQTASDTDSGLFRERVEGKSWANTDVPSGQYIPFAGTIREAIHYGGQIGDWFEHRDDNRFFELTAIRDGGAVREVNRAGSRKFPSLALALLYDNGELQIRDLTEPHAPMWWVFRPEMLGPYVTLFAAPTDVAYLDGSLYVSTAGGVTGLWRFDFVRDRVTAIRGIADAEYIMHFESVIEYQDMVRRSDAHIKSGLPELDIKMIRSVVTDDTLFDDGTSEPVLVMGTDQGIIILNSEGEFLRSNENSPVSQLHVDGVTLWWSTPDGVYKVDDYPDVTDDFPATRIDDSPNVKIAGNSDYIVFASEDGERLKIIDADGGLKSEITETKNTGWYSDSARVIGLTSTVEGSLVDETVSLEKGDIPIFVSGQVEKARVSKTNDMTWWTGVDTDAFVAFKYGQDLDFADDYFHKGFVIGLSTAGSINVIEKRGDMTKPGHYRLYFSANGRLVLEAVDRDLAIKVIETDEGVFGLECRHSFAIVLDGTTLSLYLNGGFLGSTSYLASFNSDDDVVLPLDNCRCAMFSFYDVAFDAEQILDFYLRDVRQFRDHFYNSLPAPVRAIAYDAPRKLVYVATSETSCSLYQNTFVNNIDLNGVEATDIIANESAVLVSGADSVYVEIPATSLRDKIERYRLTDSVIRYIERIENGRDVVNGETGGIESQVDDALAAKIDAEAAYKGSLVAKAEAEEEVAKAREWAEQDVDTEITFEPGHYSAKHYAEKSSESAAAAVVAQSEAATHAEGAEQSAMSAEANKNVAVQAAQDAADIIEGVGSAVEQAEIAAAASEESANEAADNAGKALQHLQDAKEWATNDVDVKVSGTDEYSAKHYALKTIASAESAVASENKAREWATNDLNDEVEPGEFSARHWALKSAEYASGALRFQGVWDASSGSYPSGAAQVGYFWKVGVEGTIDNVTWNLGDHIIWDGSEWLKVDNTESVTSVAGRTGAIVLGISDVTGLQDALNGKSDNNHTHDYGDFAGDENVILNNAKKYQIRDSQGIVQDAINFPADNIMRFGSSAYSMRLNSSALPEVWVNGNKAGSVVHTGGGQTIGGYIALESANPMLFQTNTDAATDNRTWAIGPTETSNGPVYRLQARDDSLAGGGDIIDITRDGNKLKKVLFKKSSSPFFTIDFDDESLSLGGNMSAYAFIEGGVALSEKYLSKFDAAADALALAGVDPSRFVYGSGNQATSEVPDGDWDGLSKSGFYDYDDGENAPGTDWYWGVHVSHRYSDDHGWTMVSSESSDPNWYLRGKASGNWGSWHRVLHEDISPSLTGDWSFENDILFPTGKGISVKDEGGDYRQVLTVTEGDNTVAVGGTALQLALRSPSVPFWWDGVINRDLVHVGGGQTIDGDIQVGGTLWLGASSNIGSRYNDASILEDHGNDEISLNAVGGRLNLGYRNTSSVRLLADLMADDGVTKIADKDGVNLYESGASLSTRYLGIDAKAKNSEKIEGILPSQIVYGNADTATNSVLSWEELGKSGFYAGNDLSDGPTESGSFWGIHASQYSGLNYGWTLVSSNDAEPTWFLRGKSDGNWGEWYRIITSRGGQKINGTLESENFILSEDSSLSARRSDGSIWPVLKRKIDDGVEIGDSEVDLSLMASTAPTWWDGNSSREFLHTGGNQTIDGTMFVSDKVVAKSSFPVALWHDTDKTDQVVRACIEDSNFSLQIIKDDYTTWVKNLISADLDALELKLTSTGATIGGKEILTADSDVESGGDSGIVGGQILVGDDESLLTLQPATAGGSVGINLKSQANASSDGGWIIWRDDDEVYGPASYVR